MTHRIKTIAIAATASALTVAGMAAAHGGDGKGWGTWPFASGGKSLTYSETHLQHDGEDVTLRVDQGKVVAASATAISIARNDGETVAVPVDEDTKLWGGWWRKRGASIAHHREDGAGGVEQLAAGTRVLVVRTDDDEAAEAVKVAWRHGHAHGRHDGKRGDDDGDRSRRGHDHDDD